MRQGKIAEKTFYRQLKVLTDCGISRSHLQNLHTKANNVIPFVKLVEIKFDEQTPADFVEPVSQYAHLFQKVA